MKRIAVLGVLLVAVLVCTAALSTPKPAQAIMCCDNGGYSTSQHWVMKPTCAEAQSAFRAEALPEAQADCGGATLVCGATVPGCYSVVDEFGNTQWVADGWMYYGCKEPCGPIYP